MNIHVDQHHETWIAEQIAAGRYGDPGQVVAKALDLLEQREQKLNELRQAIQEGIDSGPDEPMDFPALRKQLHEEWDARQQGQR
jgi:antitoxin ParD1/3/4